MGVPRPDGFFGNCDPKNKKNYRTRCSALLKTSSENILIDTSPDLRQQLLRHKVKKISKVSILNKAFVTIIFDFDFKPFFTSLGYRECISKNHLGYNFRFSRWFFKKVYNWKVVC